MNLQKGEHVWWTFGVFEDATGRIDKGETVGVVYLDFQKAFDIAPHQKLVWNIKESGIRVYCTGVYWKFNVR